MERLDRVLDYAMPIAEAVTFLLILFHLATGDLMGAALPLFVWLSIRVEALETALSTPATNWIITNKESAHHE